MLFIIYVIVFTPMQVGEGSVGARVAVIDINCIQMYVPGCVYGAADDGNVSGFLRGLVRASHPSSTHLHAYSRTNTHTHAPCTHTLTHSHAPYEPPRRTALSGCVEGHVPCFNYWGIFWMDLIIDVFFTADIVVNFRSAWIDTGNPRR